MQKKLETLNTLMQLAALINSSMDTKEIRTRAIEAATRLMNAEVGSLLLVDELRRQLYFEVALGEKEEILKEVRLEYGEGIAGWVAEHREPAIVHDVEKDSRFYRGADEQTHFVTRTVIAVPVITKGKVLGVLQTVNKVEGAFTEDDLELLVSLADLVASAIENARLYEQVREIFYGTTLALADALEMRDAYTGGHTRRVEQYSVAIGKELGLCSEELERLRLSAILHDIGKIGVRDHILLKNGPLSCDEFEVMHRHCEFATEMLKHVESLRDLVPAIRAHHERFDGMGYPDALEGADIPLNGRIIAVADTFDAMTSDRQYRKALPRDVALSELKRGSGRQFDPQVVDAFIEVFFNLREI